jgi:hypothetical protein
MTWTCQPAGPVGRLTHRPGPFCVVLPSEESHRCGVSQQPAKWGIKIRCASRLQRPSTGRAPARCECPADADDQTQMLRPLSAHRLTENP